MVEGETDKFVYVCLEAANNINSTKCEYIKSKN